MIQIRVSTDVPEDRQVTLKLPEDVPIGKIDLLVTIDAEPQEKEKSPRTSLGDWAENQAEHWGEEIRSTDVEGFTGRGF
jgi:hypothetical protein